MEVQLLVAEARHLLDQQDPKHLLAAHAPSSRLRLDLSAHQVGMDPAGRLGMSLKKGPDLQQLASVGVGEGSRDKRDLKGHNFTHRGRVSSVFLGGHA